MFQQKSTVWGKGQAGDCVRVLPIQMRRLVPVVALIEDDVIGWPGCGQVQSLWMPSYTCPCRLVTQNL